MRAHPAKRQKAMPIAVTERDLQILYLVYQFKLLSRQHLQRLLNWQCTSKINLRLRKLYDAHMLDRRFYLVEFGSSPAIYFLGSNGIMELARINNLDSASLQRYRKSMRNLSNSRLSHEIGISEFGSQIASYCTYSPNLKWLLWLNDTAIQNLCKKTSNIGNSGIKPDAYGRYALGRKVYNFFLEFDNGTESIWRLNKKVDAYRYFCESGAFKTYFNLHSFRVLIVTNSRNRAQMLYGKMNASSNPRVYIAHLEALVNDPIYSLNWQNPGNLNSISLHEKEIS